MLIIQTLAFLFVAALAIYLIFFTTFVESLFLRLSKRKVSKVVTDLAADVKKTAEDHERHLKKRRVELDGEISTLQNLQFPSEKKAVPTSDE